MSNKILIVEDEPLLADDIEAILEDAGYEVVGIAAKGEHALQMIENTSPDMVLLDISIDGDMDGIMLAEKINTHFGVPFVFLTSHTDKLTINRVKQTHPAGFIVKPFTEKSVLSNVEIAMYKEAPTTQLYDELFVRDGNAWVKVKFDDILYAQAYDNYTLVFVKDKKFTITHTLKTVEGKLPSDQFARIHRSYVINLNAIKKILEGSVEIADKQIPIGRTYQHFLLSKLNKL
ncbi:MAG: LytR/AlgR family response regulator transcription factor [Flavobacteriales bacterium]